MEQNGKKTLSAITPRHLLGVCILYIFLQVNVMNLNTKQRKVLFNENIDSPGAIAVDPSKGLIFWTDWKKETIERASMDGNDRMV